MLKIMGKKLFTILAEHFCLSIINLPADETGANVLYMRTGVSIIRMSII